MYWSTLNSVHVHGQHAAYKNRHLIVLKEVQSTKDRLWIGIIDWRRTRSALIIFDRAIADGYFSFWVVGFVLAQSYIVSRHHSVVYAWLQRPFMLRLCRLVVLLRKWHGFQVHCAYQTIITTRISSAVTENSLVTTETANLLNTLLQKRLRKVR